jgi:hypothetical protein
LQESGRSFAKSRDHVASQVPDLKAQSFVLLYFVSRPGKLHNLSIWQKIFHFPTTFLQNLEKQTAFALAFNSLVYNHAEAQYSHLERMLKILQEAVRSCDILRNKGQGTSPSSHFSGWLFSLFWLAASQQAQKGGKFVQNTYWPSIIN